MCEACKSDRPANMFDPKNLDHASESKRSDRRVCLPCKAKGYSSKDTAPYPSVVCGPRGHLSFEKRGAPCCVDCSRTHACCSGCSKFKRSEEEGWKEEDMKHHHNHDCRLVCQKCRRSGMTTRDTTRHRCDACSKDLGRNFFDGKMQNKKTKEKAGRSSTLICEDCAEREKTILAKLTSVKGERHVARLCSCKHRQPLGHEEKCRLYPNGYSGDNKITLQDLRFLRLRPAHVKKYNIP